MDRQPLDLAGFGWGLSGALVVLLLICEIAAWIFPGWVLSHNWLMLFSAAEAGSLRNLLDGVVFSVLFGWIAAAVLVVIYNRVVKNS
jgi:hypothetical protein